MAKPPAAKSASAPTTPARGGGRGRVTERVVDEICAYIEREALQGGDKLPPERVFMELFSVGRSSLREALRVLSATGVIEVVHGDGMYVAAANPSASTTTIFDATEESALRNLVETRLGIELAIVTALAERGTDADFDALEALLDEQQEHLENDPSYQWEPLGFELTAAGMCGNSWLYDVELLLRDAWVTLSRGTRTRVSRHREWHSEHRAILASMRTRNVRQAQRLVMAHVSLERFEQDLSRARKR
ncbi:MAG: FadR family transcriptional regulator [Nocardioides sp.]|nr:FadR family transcriptional regulator [Nocardioides sp.]